MGKSFINGQTPCLMGKSSISTGPFSSSQTVDITRLGTFLSIWGTASQRGTRGTAFFVAQRAAAVRSGGAKMKTRGATQASPKVMSVSQSAEGVFSRVHLIGNWLTMVNNG